MPKHLLVNDSKTTGLDELVDNVGKSSSQMRQFFQGMINRGELMAYSVEIDKQEIVSDTDYERITRTIKGATLTSINNLWGFTSILVEDTETKARYNLNIGSGIKSVHSDSIDIHHICLLEKLPEQFDPRKIVDFRRGYFGDEINVRDMVSARLIVNYDENHKSALSHVVAATGKLTIKGEQDSLFKKAYEFVKG